MKLLFFNIFVLLLCSCNGGGVIKRNVVMVDSMQYAKHLSITHYDDYTQVDINNPWDTTKFLQRYALVPKNSKLEEKDIAGFTIIKTPIENIVVYNSVHASIIENLGASDKIVGACEIRYLDSEKVKKRISEGLIADIGEATSPNVEKIIDIQTEVILSSPFKDAGYGAVEKLNIPIVEGADYMEQHPLGRVEWVKFYGLLFGAKTTADSIFNSTCKEYHSLKKLTQNIDERPTVIAERRYGSQWFIPGGNSYNATLFADAGADYIFSYIENSGSIPLAAESVLDKGINADIWVLKYNYPYDMSYNDLANEHELYSKFDAFKNRRVFGCNTGTKRYYEDIPMKPHLLLREYIYIFHPELLPDFKPHYFAPLIDSK